MLDVVPMAFSNVNKLFGRTNTEDNSNLHTMLLWNALCNFEQNVTVNPRFVSEKLFLRLWVIFYAMSFSSLPMVIDSLNRHNISPFTPYVCPFVPITLIFPCLPDSINLSHLPMLVRLSHIISLHDFSYSYVYSILNPYLFITHTVQKIP